METLGNRDTIPRVQVRKMITFLLFLNFSLMILMPIGLGWLIASRRKVSWSLFGVGIIGFIVSQVFHIPFNWFVLQRQEWLPTDTAVPFNLVILSLFLGLSAGLFEEVTRYLFYRFGIKKARSWGQGLMFGAGWGGIEAILLGVLGLINFVILLGLKNDMFTELIPADQMGLVDQAINEMFGLPWSMALLGGLERAFALCLHLSLSLLVLQAFLRRNIVWLLVAILWHTVVDVTAVFSIQFLTPICGTTEAALMTEAIIGVYALISLWIIFNLKTPEPVLVEPEPLPAPDPVQPIEMPLHDDMLDKSKFS